MYLYIMHFSECVLYITHKNFKSKESTWITIWGNLKYKILKFNYSDLSPKDEELFHYLFLLFRTLPQSHLPLRWPFL